MSNCNCRSIAENAMRNCSLFDDGGRYDESTQHELYRTTTNALGEITYVLAIQKTRTLGFVLRKAYLLHNAGKNDDAKAILQQAESEVTQVGALEQENESQRNSIIRLGTKAASKQAQFAYEMFSNYMNCACENLS